MRIIFFILLVLNLALLTLFQFPGTRAGEPMKGHEPLQAEKIKLLSEAEIKARKAPVPATTAAATKVTSQCLEWGAIAPDDMNRAKLALKKLKLWEKASVHKAEKASGYWVYLPPRKSLAEAQKKMEELKRLGIEETFILKENTQWRNAISLGVFSTEEAAAKYLTQVKGKGVNSAVAGPRIRETDASMLTFNNLEAGMAESVAKLKPEFPGSEIKTVDCR